MDHTSKKTAVAGGAQQESYWLAAWKNCQGLLLGREGKIFFLFVGIFLVAYYLPLGNPKVEKAVLEAFLMLQAYARNHTLTCVVPALFIAGAIITFLSQASVMRYLGPTANKFLAYTVASVSGTILAVCSCSVLPMFAGIYQMGAGLGPASAFLYSGPGINILAIFLTARVLGFELGLARVVGAVSFAFLVGILMAFFFRKEEKAKVAGGYADAASRGAPAAFLANERVLFQPGIFSHLRRLGDPPGRHHPLERRAKGAGRGPGGALPRHDFPALPGLGRKRKRTR